MIKIYNIINIILLKLARLVIRQDNKTPDKKSFLIIRLDAIGDMVLFSAFMREFRKQEPSAKITLVISPLVKNLYENCPYADEILYFDGRKPIKPQLVSSTFRAMVWGIKNLKHKYNAVLLPRSGADAEGALMLAITSCAKEIISFSEQQTPDRATTNKNYNQFITQPILIEATQHEVIVNLDFLRKMGYTDIDNNDIEIWPTEEDSKKVEHFLCEHNINDKQSLIAIGFSAAQKHRCWPVEKFLTLIMLLYNHYKDAQIILIGGPTDTRRAEYMKSKNPALINVAGKLTLRETFILLKKCNLYIGNDSGPMHLAAVGKTPVIEISSFPQNGKKSHPSSPARFGPWGVESQIIQPQRSLYPCINYCKAKKAHCIAEISIDTVFSSINRIIMENKTYEGK